MVDWAYVHGYGDEGGDPDHDIHDPEGHTGHVSKDSYGPRLTCKFCGSSEVFWARNRDGWKVMNKGDMELHQCRDAASRTSEGFDDVA